MTAVAEIVECARQHDVEISVCGDRLKLRAPVKPPDDLLARIRTHKPDILRLLYAASDDWKPIDWQAFFDERAGVFEYDGGLDRPKAEARAYECCITEWLNGHPEQSVPGRCALCGMSDRSDHAIVPFGADGRCHTWLHPECWNDWLERRRDQARQALAEHGVSAP